jgi:5-methylcytosine-specific restriction protein B
VDYALRRRFAFLNIVPTFNHKFKNELVNLGVDEGIIDQIIIKINTLNEEISNGPNLGKGFRIGHSYFCNVPKGSGDIDWYNSIVKHEIAPLIEEYWFDNDDKSSTEIKRLYLI